MRFAGYAAVFDRPDSSGDVVRRGAFAAAVAAGRAVPLLWQHRPDAPIGRIEMIAEDSRGLRVIGRVSPDSAAGRDAVAALSAGALNGPCAAWHRDFAVRAKAAGYGLIWSLSYELLDAHCWGEWKQRAENGDPALTGWEPPSTLLSPAHAGAMGYLRAVARAFAAIAKGAGLTVRFQVGEPWWWVMPDGPICLYDDAARAAFDPVSIGSVLDPLAPEVRRANVPVGWARPAFNVLQTESYDWVTRGDRGATARGVAAAEARLGYPAGEQHYLAGFVLNPEDAVGWAEIDAATGTARARRRPLSGHCRKWCATVSFILTRRRRPWSRLTMCCSRWRWAARRA